jgi:hypothetical protein
VAVSTAVGGNLIRRNDYRRHESSKEPLVDCLAFPGGVAPVMSGVWDNEDMVLKS